MLQKCMGLGSSSYKSVHIVVIDKILIGHTPYLQTLLDDVLIVRSDVTMSEYFQTAVGLVGCRAPAAKFLRTLGYAWKIRRGTAGTVHHIMFAIGHVGVNPARRTPEPGEQALSNVHVFDATDPALTLHD